MIFRGCLGVLLLMVLAGCSGGSGDVNAGYSNGVSIGQSGETNAVTPILLHESIPRFYGLTVTANFQEIELANVPVNIRRSWINPPIPERYFRDSAVAMFDMEDEYVEISVTRPAGVESAVVRPARANITPTINGDTVTFIIRRWGQYVLEFNDDPLTDGLHIFANPPFVPTENSRQITGSHHGNLHVNDGETVTLMPGSVVHGGVTMGNNTRIEGRGIIWGHGPQNFVADGQVLSQNANAIRVWDSTNVEVDGIAAFNQSRWVVEFRNSYNVDISNIKIISAGNNGDGITIQSSRNMRIDRSFVRSWDDALVVKNYSPIDSGDISFTNMVLWVDLAQAMEIGYETNAGNESWFGGRFNRDAQIYNILFEDIDVVHANHQSVISIHNDNRALVRDIVFRNIIVDNANMSATHFRYLIDFRNYGKPHSFQGYRNCDGEHWAIDNIIVDGVWVMGGRRDWAGWVFNDMNGRRPITGVYISNVFWVPGMESLWEDMHGAPDGVSFMASPFIAPPLEVCFEGVRQCPAFDAYTGEFLE